MPSPFSNAQTAIGAFFELLREANPSMNSSINEDNVDVVSIQAIVPVNGLNTQVTLQPKSGNQAVDGAITLRYRRLELTNVVGSFASAFPGVRKIFGSPANLSLVSDVNPYSARYRKKISEQLGFFWDNASDFTVYLNRSLAAYGTTDNGVTLYPSANHLCYIGGMSLNLPLTDVNTIENVFTNRIAAQELELMENADVALKLMAVYPTNSNGLLAAANSAFGSATTFSNTVIAAGHQPFFNVVNAITGLDLRADAGYAGAGLGVGGQYISKLSASSSVIQLRKNGVLIDSALNARYKNHISQKWGKVLYIDRFYTGWQKTGIVIPLIANL